MESQLNKYKNFIIDTSAFMAFFYKEEGWETVTEYMPKSVMSAVNLSEVIKIFVEYENLTRIESLEYTNKVLEKIISFDEEQACLAGEMISISKQYGLSLGDRACIAAGIHTGFPIVTADKVWKEVKFKEAQIVVIR